jgi:hypothetical protein
VTLTAGSVADKTKSNSVTLTIPAAPAITTASLPAATAGAAYSTTLTGSGGIAPYTWSLKSGTLPTGVSLNATTGVLSAAAGATTATSATPLIFQMTDSGSPTALTATATLSLTINAVQYAPVVGNVLFNSPCGSVVGPTVSVSINTTPVQTTTTDSNGNFTFASVPQGTPYTITPSLVGTNALFSPVTQSVTAAKGGAIINFNAVVGYSVSGTVSYSGQATGPINLVLQDQCPNGSVVSAQVTSIPSPGSFTINGAAPGSYMVKAWLDALNNGSYNASDPASYATAGTIASANLTGVSVPLTDPGAVSFHNAATFLLFAFPFDQGALLKASEIIPNTGISEELPTSYTVQWSTDSTFNTITGSKSFPADGILEKTWVVSGLQDGQALNFRYQGVAGSATSSWSNVAGPVTIGGPTGSIQVTGNVIFSNPATGPLYIQIAPLAQTPLINSPNQVISIANPVSPQHYSFPVPADGKYIISAFIDQNNDNAWDDGDMFEAPYSASGYHIAVTGGSATQDITMVGGGSRFISSHIVNQQYANYYGRTSQSYYLVFSAANGSKQLEGVKLISGPNLIVPLDIGPCSNRTSYSFCGSVQLDGNAPNVGDAYNLQITYSDGSQETVTETVASVPGSFGANPTPSGIGTNLTPNFSWTDPANASSYQYSFEFDGNTEWYIPNFSSSIDSVTWGVDPTGAGYAPYPAVSSLTNGNNYDWLVAAYDSSSNESSIEVGYYPGYNYVYLPSTNPSTLGAATVGQNYTGTIVASSGVSPYDFTVVGLCDGLTYSSNGGTLTITGTPIAAGVISFQVIVQDSTFWTWGPVTYTINVGN